MEPTRVIVITGPPGVGKTETARGLIEFCPERSAILDSDAVGGIHPFRVDEAFYRLVSRNLEYCLESYAEWKARVVVLSGVFIPEGLYRVVANLRDDPRFSWKVYSLVASEDALRRRIVEDGKAQDASQRLQWLYLNDIVKNLPGATVLDTTNLDLPDVISTIARLEGLQGGRKVPVRSTAFVTVKISEIRQEVTGILHAYGATDTVATRVADDLLLSESEGYPSHGLVRLIDYIREVGAGTLYPAQEPEVRPVSPLASVVDGRRGFGIMAVDAVQQELLRLLSESPVGVVGLTNANHIGRLAHMGEPVARKGFFLLGFANFLGAGQRMPPWGGAAGRFCTNPIVFAAPGPTPDEPVVVDLTTSAVSEGRVRMAQVNGMPASPGWLVDDHGRTVTDPNRLYSDPPSAFLAPLGGAFGHKGSALALAVEILAGVLSGAGCVRPNAGPGGNGAFVIGIRPDVLGLSESVVNSVLRDLYSYCTTDCPPAKHVERIRLPGQGSRESVVAAKKHNTLSLSETLWHSILDLRKQSNEVQR